jgi:hypothetical protein
MNVLRVGMGIFLLLATLAAVAESRFASPRPFVLDTPCEAYTSLKKKTDAETLVVGNTYQGVAENKTPGATHVLLRLGYGSKWLALACGHYADAGSAESVTVVAAPPPTQCLPFFDEVDNPVNVGVGGKVDITPPAPPLNDFDRAVNDVCGAPGKVVSPAEFQALLRSHADVLQGIRRFTGSRVYANRPEPASDEAYLQDLTDAWFSLKAFDHIFCGQPEAGGPIGGLHFYGRYEQLQASGDACRMDNYRQNEVVPGVLYSMGASMKAANGGMARSSIKGYGLTLNAEDILKAATRAFSENPTNATESTACMLPVADDGKQFAVVFVRRSNGIRTFYPDATPSATDPACTAPVSLQ